MLRCQHSNINALRLPKGYYKIVGPSLIPSYSKLAEQYISVKTVLRKYDHQSYKVIVGLVKIRSQQLLWRCEDKLDRSCYSVEVLVLLTP